MSETKNAKSLQIKHINKYYEGDVHAVKDVSIDVVPGEFLVLVGPSGCGKSTILRMLAGLEKISSGEIWLDGQKINNMLPKNRDIAMVFQNYALYPTMSVYNNLAFPLKMRRWKRNDIRERVLEVAAQLEIEPYLKRRPGALSGGQRQRVALGRAMVREPALFLMDEPLSNLDAELRVQMRHEIVALQRRLNITTVYVTHDQVEAMTMGSRIAVMKDGILQQIDTPRKLYNEPINTFVAGFIGSPPMNFWEGSYQASHINIGEYETDMPDFACLQDGETYQFGIRPENMSIAIDDQKTDFVGEITAIEEIGRETFVYMKIDGVEDIFALAMIGENEFNIGDDIPIHLDWSRIHTFDLNGVRVYNDGNTLENEEVINQHES